MVTANNLTKVFRTEAIGTTALNILGLPDNPTGVMVTRSQKDAAQAHGTTDLFDGQTVSDVKNELI